MKRGNKASDLYSTCCLRDGRAYNYFCEKNKIDLEQSQYDDILLLFQQKLIQKIVSNRDGIELPNGLGDIKIIGLVPKIPPIDHKNTLKYNKPIFLTNAHTMGIKYRLIWVYKYANRSLRKLARFKNMELYIFKTSKYIKRAMYNSIMEKTSTRDVPDFHIVEGSQNYNPKI